MSTSNPELTMIDILLSESLVLQDQDSIYQTEIVFNKLLPYADELDEEADKLLAYVKANLGKCVMLRDVNPGCIYWSRMLTKYIMLYGLRFTKEEHVAFVKLMYELTTIPNLESSHVVTFASILTTLIKKRELLSSDDLQLPWRPLFKLSWDAFSQKYKINRDHPSLQTTLETLIPFTSPYYPPSATQEILDELMPKLSPFDNLDTQSFEVFRFFCFLPVQLNPKYHSIGHELWFHEFMKLWEVYHNQPEWEYYIMKLMLRLAWNNIGYIDWNPHIPLMFTRLFRTLNLPCYYKGIPSATYHDIEMRFIGQWIASVLGGNSCAQTYLDKLLKSIETFLHPANQGMWVHSLEDMMLQLCHCIVVRVHKERFAKPTWLTPIPDSHKLSDADIDGFVDSILPVVMIAVFNNFCSVMLFNTIKFLSFLRPNKVIVSLLEKFSPTVGAEEHMATFAMKSMSAIARPLIQGPSYYNKEHAFVEGPSHALSILFSCLSNIDPNDTTKCLDTFKLITIFVSQIPLIDCSQSRGEKTEDERLACEKTSGFEDFLCQLMDKIFALVELSALEFVRLESQPSDCKKNNLETYMENSVCVLFWALLQQTSDAIFGSALNKLRHFIEDSSFETKVAGQLVAYICAAFSSVNAQETLKALVPYLSEEILDALGDGDDALKEENLDNRLLYHLLLLRDTLSVRGDALLPYMDTIVKVLDKVTKFKSLEGQQLGVQVLKNTLYCLCTVKSVKLERNLDDPNYPYWREWGESVKIKAAKIRWYMPGEREITAAEMLFKRYFVPAVTHVQEYVAANKSDAQLRDELQRNLRIINNILMGGEVVFPYWSEQPLLSEPYQSCAGVFLPIVGNKFSINMPDGTNVRQFLIRLVTSLQEMILNNVEDDVKSLTLICYILDELSMNRSLSMTHVIALASHYQGQKTELENKITGDHGLVPTTLMTRMQIQQKLRHVRSYTATSRDIVANLFKLSISQYSAIRSLAQTILADVVKGYPNAYQHLIDEIVEIFSRDTEAHHDAYKGALYLLNTISRTLLKISDWQIYNKILPAFVLAKPSEKLSVIQQQTQVVQVFMKAYNTINVKLEVPDSCVSAVAKLWQCGVAPVASQPPTEQQIQQGVVNLRARGEENLKLYYDTLDKLLHAILEKNLHWRHRQNAMNFFEDLIHPDHLLPAAAVRYFLNALICESIDERKLAWYVVPAILYQLKREHPKIQIDTPKQAEKGWKPGPRADNAWLQYSRDKVPRTAEEWEKPRYVHKSYTGYYTWPKKLEVYAPSSQQPNLDRKTREMNDQEKEFDRFFSDPQNVDKLITFNTLEEIEGNDFFGSYRSSIFLGLAINHGDAFLDNFLPHLEKMVQDKQESQQRCAAEIISGFIRGAKHWNFQMTDNLYKKLLPIVRMALSNISDETITDWFSCFNFVFQNRDVSRMHWLMECLVEESEKAQAEVSFVECARLQILGGAVSHQSWRLSELLHRIMDRIESRLLDCPYDNLRDELALMLVQIFHVDMKYDKQQRNSIYPSIDDFVDKVYLRLEPLLTIEDRKSQECVQLLRLLENVCTWILQSVQGSHFGAIPSFYRFYPLISRLENEEQNGELAETCSQTLATLAHAFVLPEYVPFALKTLDECSKSSSWSVRTGSIQFLQVLLFHNMSTLLSNKAWIFEIRAVLMRLIKDERVEVRETAAEVLNGMLHCKLIDEPKALLEEFKKFAKTTLRNKKAESSSTSTNAIILRHAGVLGMCAFIQAHPYDIPPIVPPIFEHLSAHLNDPEPIPTTIRKTLNDFKRTHCNGWTGLQGLAEHLSSEQFDLLQDLTVPPSYYA